MTTSNKKARQKEFKKIIEKSLNDIFGENEDDQKSALAHLNKITTKKTNVLALPHKIKLRLYIQSKITHGLMNSFYLLSIHINILL